MCLDAVGGPDRAGVKGVPDKTVRGQIDFQDPALPVAGGQSVARQAVDPGGRWLPRLDASASFTWRSPPTSHWFRQWRTLSRRNRRRACTPWSWVINAGLRVLAVALLATLLFGRFVCGWGCHLARAAGPVWLVSLRRLGIRPQLPASLRLLAWIAGDRGGLPCSRGFDDLARSSRAGRA